MTTVGRKLLGAVWTTAASIPLAIAVNELVVGAIPPGIHNAGEGISIKDNEVVLVRRRVKADDGDLIIYKWPLSATGYGVGKVSGTSGDLYLSQHGMLERVQQGQVYVTCLQDRDVGHENDSCKDSRDFGPLSVALIEGKVIGVAWPPSSIRRHLK